MAKTEVRELLVRIEKGESQLTEELLPIVYDHLRNLASFRLANDPAGDSLQTTELVHEAYLRLVGKEWEGTKHFFGAAAEAMRRILVDRARRRMTTKHGGELRRVELDRTSASTRGPLPEEVLAVHDLLDQLAAEYPMEAEIVKLHYFGGLNISEAGDLLGLSSSTAHRYWTFARAWLRDAAQ
jgi:RNA polymerase sigma factor (TIGR02999 family)